ncbi:hypothetical protein H671_5g14367 [Cricetulus griseus]|nr:hypothetical protein H671_5g14367 [Cricetulus griseus]
MTEYLSFAKIGNIFAYYMNSVFEEDANLPITSQYTVIDVSLLLEITLLARVLRNRDKNDLTTYLQEITALHNEVLENRLGQATIVQQVEQKLDDKLGPVSTTLKTELSVTNDKMQCIYKINTERSSMSEALEARLSEDCDELKNICSQLETQIGSVTQKQDAKVQNTQDRVEELGNVIQTIIEASKVADHKFESKFECLEDNLQYRTDRLDGSIQSIAEDSKSANHDLKSRLQYLEGSFCGIQMLSKDDHIKDLEKHQWNTQINIPPVSDTNYVQSLESRKDLVRRYGKRLPIIQAVQKLGTNDRPSEDAKALRLKWFTDEPDWLRKTCLTAIPAHPGKKTGHTSSTALDPTCSISTEIPARASGASVDAKICQYFSASGPVPQDMSSVMHWSSLFSEHQSVSISSDHSL